MAERRAPASRDTQSWQTNLCEWVMTNVLPCCKNSQSKVHQQQKARGDPPQSILHRPSPQVGRPSQRVHTLGEHSVVIIDDVMQPVSVQVQGGKLPSRVDPIPIVNPCPKEEVKFIERQPLAQEKNEYRYLCPICFRYFSKILSFTCCENYLCYLCAEDLTKKFSDPTTPEPVCIFCKAKDPILANVDLNEKSRKYEDYALSRSYNDSVISEGQSGGIFVPDQVMGENMDTMAQSRENNTLKRLREGKVAKRSMVEFMSEFKHVGAFQHSLAYRLSQKESRRNSA